MINYLERSLSAMFEDYDILRNRIYNETLEEFVILLHNAIKIENKPDGVPEEYILRVLFQDGRIAVYNGMWLHAAATGRVTLYGKSTQYNLRGDNGTSFLVNAAEIALIKSNAYESSIYQYLETSSAMIASAKVAMIQNIKASQRAKLLIADSPETSKSIKRVVDEIDKGKPVVIFKETLSGNLQTEDMAITYQAEKYSEIAKEIRDEVLTRLGILSANTNKRERVQSAEVYASVGEAYDSINVIIDTFNRDAERQQIPTRLKLNASIQDLYLDDNSMVKEDETKDEE